MSYWANKSICANIVLVHASLQQFEMEEEEEEEKKTTSARRITLLKEGLYKALAEKRLDGYQ